MARSVPSEPEQALSREDKTLLGVIALGYTIEECSEFLDKSDSAIMRHRRRLLEAFRAPTMSALLVYAVTMQLMSLTTVMKWLEDDAAGAVEQFRRVKRAFQHRAPFEEQLAELRLLILADPRSVEPPWRSSEPQGLAGELLNRLKLTTDDVGNPFMLIVAVLADLGELQWSGAESAEGLVTTRRVIGAFTVTITGPANESVTVTAGGKTRNIKLPPPHPSATLDIREERLDR